MIQRQLNRNAELVAEGHHRLLEAQIELQREFFDKQDKRDRSAEAARARLSEAQAMPREQVIHQHITNVERPELDVSTLLEQKHTKYGTTNVQRDAKTCQS